MVKIDKLNKLLVEVTKNVPFYINYFQKHPDKDPQDIKNYPIIMKKDLVNRYDQFLNLRFNPNELITKNTSGSTGIPLKVLRTQIEEENQLKILWKRRFLDYGISPTSKYLVFYLSRYSFDNPEFRYKLLNDKVLAINISNITKSELSNLSQIIMEFEPCFIMGTPSSVFDLVINYKKFDLHFPSSISYIELMSEPILDYQRITIESFFNCFVSNHYGCTEVMGIAQEHRKCNHLHVFEDNVFVETNTTSYGTELLVTSLNSKAFPFIRYNIGDIVTLVYDHDCLVDKAPIINLKFGRSNDLIKMSDGSYEHSAILSRIVEKITNKVSPVERFKIEQIDFESFNIYLSLKEKNHKFEVKELFYNELKKIHKNSWIIEFHFIDFDDFTKLQKGKKFCYFERKF
jgi:Coenzyme F390 synthetase